MDLVNQYKKKSFILVTMLAVLLAAGSGAGLFYGLQWGLPIYSSETGNALLTGYIPIGLEYLNWIQNHFFQWVIPALVGGFLILAWIFWGILVLAVAPMFIAYKPPAEEGLKPKTAKKDFLDQKLEQDRKRRLFLHTMSVLQREGRLLDFFDEDLGLYEDEQIGAAVRSIQEDCKKAVKKYINPQPVMEHEEGAPVTIEPGFDMDAVTLVGNVAGEPPFEGILRHRGWKAGKKEIPKLSDIQDAGIIIPAEVEIQ